MKSVLAFWKELLRNPRRVGAIGPSGVALGSAMVKVVMADRPGFVVELGAGTGSITRSLIGIRHELDDLIVVEKSTEMVELLARRYPCLKIFAGCASQLGCFQFPAGCPLTIVSSLPLRSLPDNEVHEIKQMIATLSHREAGFRFIQYSYFGRLPFRSPTSWLGWEKVQTVFANVPPATVWLMRRRAEVAAVQ